MYKVNVNSNYFQNSLKNSEETKKNSSKAKFLLTDLQRQFIESKLPIGHKLIITNQIQEKRNRAPKKKDSLFETQYRKKESVKEAGSSQKKIQKSNETTGYQKGYTQQSSIKQATFKLLVPKIQTALSNIEHSLIKKAQADKKHNQQEKSQKIRHQQKIQQKTSVFSMVQQTPLVISAPRNEQQQNKTPTIITTSQYKQAAKPTPSSAVKVNKQEQAEATSLKQTKTGESLSNEQKQFCIRFLGKLKAYKSSWPFRQPVDPINQGVPDYLQVIHEPMDLRTIQKKLNSCKYEHPAEFHGDINKIFLNSYKFNPRETNYYALTIELENYYHELLKEVESNPNILEQDRQNKNIKAKLTIKNEQEFVEEEQPLNKKIKMTHSSSVKTVLDDQVLQNSESKQKPQESLIKLNKSQNLKLKPKAIDLQRIDRKQLLKKAQKLSSRALQDIINVAFGDVTEEMTSFSLDFEKLSDSIILKIRDIVQMDLQREGKSLNCTIQSRMLLF